MNIPADVLPAELLRVESIYQQAKIDPSNNKMTSWLTSALGDAVESCEDSLNIVVQKELVRQWLNYFSHLFANDETPHYLKNDADVFVEYLLTKTSSKSLDLDREHEVVLAGLILSRVISRTMGHDFPPRNTISDLLKVWTGKQPSYKELSTAKEAVDFIYGTIVWDLYGDGIDHISKLPALLVNSGVYPAGILIRPSLAVDTAQLPSNLQGFEEL